MGTSASNVRLSRRWVMADGRANEQMELVINKTNVLDHYR